MGVEYKIILVGDSNSGKSALMKRYCEGRFNENVDSTIGMDLRIKTYIQESMDVIKLKIWDTSGQERYQSLISNYYLHSDGIMIVFDVSKPDQKELEKWIHRVNENSDAPMLVVANKCDLPHSDTKYLQTSAKTGQNVDLAFKTLVDYIIASKFTEIPLSPMNPLILLEYEPNNEQKKGCCY